MTEIRCLSLHEPWASLIAYGVKTIETRDWLPPKALRDGPFTLLVHAAKRLDECHAWEPFRSTLHAAMRAAGDQPHFALGCVVAVANVYRAAFHPGGLADATFAEQARWGLFGPGRAYWFLSRHVDRLPEPIPLRGRQGLWRPDPGLVDQIRAQLPDSPWLP